jgi:hypothetical protein
LLFKCFFRKHFGVVCRNKKLKLANKSFVVILTTLSGEYICSLLNRRHLDPCRSLVVRAQMVIVEET